VFIVRHGGDSAGGARPGGQGARSVSES
jgi:hypothetical protein